MISSPHSLWLIHFLGGTCTASGSGAALEEHPRILESAGPGWQGMKQWVRSLESWTDRQRHGESWNWEPRAKVRSQKSRAMSGRWGSSRNRCSANGEQRDMAWQHLVSQSSAKERGSWAQQDQMSRCI